MTDAEPLQLDRIDRKILQALQADGRISNLKLSEEVSLSPTAVLARVQRLTRAGVILGYEVRLDAERLGAGLMVFVEVLLDKTTPNVFEAFKAAVQVRPEIMECHMVAGGFDYLLKTRMADMNAYREFAGTVLWQLPGVRETRTYAVMEEPKMALPTRTMVLPLATAASRSALMPIDRVSSASPAAFKASKRPLALLNTAQEASKSEAGSGMHMSPRNCNLGKPATACANASASAGATPDLVGPPSMLTCTHTCSGGSVSGRCSLRRCAIFSRSTVCTQSKCSATSRVLLLWIGPMQCHCSGRSRSSAIFSTASWM
jgi:Lrp/AsnC family leucine-responsive transcriptional regulator